MKKQKRIKPRNKLVPFIVMLRHKVIGNKKKNNPPKIELND